MCVCARAHEDDGEGRVRARAARASMKTMEKAPTTMTATCRPHTGQVKGLNTRTTLPAPGFIIII